MNNSSDFSMRSRYCYGFGPNGFHRIHFTEWGDPSLQHAVFCVHGLTRNARDFDDLAGELCGQYRIICPDMPGRGLSDWLDCKQDYNLGVYLNDIATLIACTGVQSIDWIGTSMGGVIGMLVASLANNPVQRLLVNDIGPTIDKAARERIAGYAGMDPRFDSLSELENYLRLVHATFGPLTDAQWAHMSRHSNRPLNDGGVALHYDPGIAEPFRDQVTTPVEFWEYWDRIQCPVLLFRGCESDLLSAETAEQMQQRGPATTVVEFEGIGHAPSLMAADQIERIRAWLQD